MDTRKIDAALNKTEWFIRKTRMEIERRSYVEDDDE